ncbi:MULTISPECIES: DUF4956 domain-containing protein [Streptomyces]|uniref:DUF4956 domain-containing protein n=1 Tax=Streptomyces TaxID=1883 RepID=UPI000894CE50|nr:MULTISPECIES: DUF4956 domain-containing protein [unclassified Streptomyces]SEB93080.1 Uncharacterized membrane protein YhiD, involved in acid resistance [Streptomyces sp. PAN_FS17]SED95715.1 Uncharacterized membrane protein YhiD, involved in acid resistance [Streptomyces sp. KS_5]
MNFDLQELSGTFSVTDVVVAMSLSFVLSTLIGHVYRYTHRNVSYSQSYVQTLIIVGMVVALIMLVVGSNLARAFSLVGALSVIRFRNAIKETRDVGFVFLAMAIGMACGARFYTLAAVAAVVICVVVVLMFKFNWFALSVQRQVVKVQVPAGEDYSSAIRDVLIRYTTEFELVSTETIRGGALNEVFYTVRMKKGTEPSDLVTALQERTSGQRVTVLTGYDSTDL